MDNYEKRTLRESTRHRRRLALFTSLLFFVATLFLVLVNIGQVRNVNVLNQWYFFRFDVSNIIPSSDADATLLNTFATSVGLHDFYDVGMWNYCEGYDDKGITDCSTPQLLYWFNPVAIIQSELLKGAQITLPSEVVSYLHIVQVASQVMFGCFFAATLASFVSTLLAPLAVHSKLRTIPIAIFSLLTTLSAAIGAGISTGIWTVLQMELQKYASDINIVATLGVPLFVFQWIAAGCCLIATLLQIGMMCCGTSRRDIMTGRHTAQSGGSYNEKGYGYP